MTVYCNVAHCKNWLSLEEVHHMKNKPGFKPIGKTDEYTGKCSFSNIVVDSSTARSRNTKQVLATCGSYNKDESEVFICKEERCTFYLDVNRCEKIKFNEDLYIDLTVVFDSEERKEVPRCKVFSHRWRENAFNWGNAAQGIF